MHQPEALLRSGAAGLFFSRYRISPQSYLRIEPGSAMKSRVTAVYRDRQINVSSQLLDPPEFSRVNRAESGGQFQCL